MDTSHVINLHKNPYKILKKYPINYTKLNDIFTKSKKYLYDKRKRKNARLLKSQKVSIIGLEISCQSF